MGDLNNLERDREAFLEQRKREREAKDQDQKALAERLGVGKKRDEVAENPELAALRARVDKELVDKQAKKEKERRNRLLKMEIKLLWLEKKRAEGKKEGEFVIGREEQGKAVLVGTYLDRHQASAAFQIALEEVDETGGIGQPILFTPEDFNFVPAEPKMETSPQTGDGARRKKKR